MDPVKRTAVQMAIDILLETKDTVESALEKLRQPLDLVDDDDLKTEGIIKCPRCGTWVNAEDCEGLVNCCYICDTTADS